MSTTAQTVGEIYTSGDILLNNPVQWCVIFVSVVLVSASIQYLTAFLKQRITNRYAKLMNQTTQQEITVVGVVATCLMLATSFLPADSNQSLYAGLFSWTTMLVFFSAFLYVLEMLVQFFVCSADMASWRKYEEGRLDSDDADRLVLRQRHYRLAYDRFMDEIKIAFQVSPRECPLCENVHVFHKRYLARMADFSYRSWLSLSVVALCNLARTYFTPYANPSNDDEHFLNAIVYCACTGWFVLIAFIVFCALLFLSMSDLVNKKLKRSTVGAEIVPFWSPLRSIEFLQCVYLSLNYYMVVFVLGILDTIKGSGRGVAVAALFAFPILAVMAATPWVIWALSIMSVLGSAKKNRAVIQKIVRESRGQYDDSDEAEDGYSDLDDDVEPRRDRVIDRLQRNQGKRPARLTSSRPLIPEDEAQQHERGAQRPLWLDDDEEWDGKKTLGVGARGSLNQRDEDGSQMSPHGNNLEFLYYDNVDGEDFDRVASRIAPELVHERLGSGPTTSVEGQSERQQGHTARSSDGQRGRPIWADSDEEFDI
jgi:hypothetical protein